MIPRTNVILGPEHKGQRLLLTDRYVRRARYELTLLEVSPSQQCGKFRNELQSALFWADLSDYFVLDILPNAIP